MKLDSPSTKSLLAVLLTFFASSLSLSQSHSFRHYGTNNGLNSSTVYSCLQDSKGFMWFATDAGVARFNGISFEQFTKNDGLSDIEVFRMFEDSKHRIWFLTLNGHLSYYSDGKFYNEKNTPFLKELFVGESFTAAFEDSKGNLYLGTFGAPLLVIGTDNSIVRHNIDGAYGAFSFFENSNGEVYAASAARRVRVRKDRIEDALLQNVRLDVRYIYSKLNHDFYFSEKGLTRIDRLKETLVIPAEMLPSFHTITGCWENADSSFSVSTRSNGVLQFPRVVSKTTKPERVLTDKIVLSVFADGENNKWYNTEGDGVYMLSDAGRNVKSFTQHDGLPVESINCIEKSASGEIWAAGERQSIMQITSDTVLSYHISTVNNRNDRILDITFDKENYLWLGTDNGIVRFDPKNGSRRIPLKIGDIRSYPSCKSISYEKDGRIIASHFRGVAVCDPAKYDGDVCSPLYSVENSTRVFTHFIDRKGRMWIANINGLSLWDGRKLIDYGEKDELLKSRILQINETGDMLLLSTGGNGVIFFKNNKVVYHLNRKNGLPSDICRRMFVSGNHLWVCTNLGLADVTISNDKVTHIEIINQSNGLISDDVRDVLDDDSLIYIATDKGLCVMGKDPAKQVLDPPPLYITNVSVNNRTVETAQPLALSYDENFLVIKFIALTYQSPEKIIYQYRLNTQKASWITTNNNSIEFSSLSPSEYIFEVRAKKINSDWSKPVTLHFHIYPPFWKTWWFITLVAIAVILAVYFIHRYYSRLKLNRQLVELSRREIILKERSRISTDMHDDLGADLSRIVVLTEVMKVSDGSSINTSASSHLNKISGYATDLRAKVDEIIWALNPHHDSLKDLISYIHSFTREYLEDCPFKFQLEIPAFIPDIAVSAAFRRNVFLITKEALHNIVKHSAATNVKIKIAADEANVEIAIEDNGKGFVKDKIKAGNGFVNMRKRAAEIGGLLTVISSEGMGCKIIFNGNIH